MKTPFFWVYVFFLKPPFKSCLFFGFFFLGGQKPFVVWTQAFLWARAVGVWGIHMEGLGPPGQWGSGVFTGFGGSPKNPSPPRGGFPPNPLGIPSPPGEGFSPPFPEFSSPRGGPKLAPNHGGGKGTPPSGIFFGGWRYFMGQGRMVGVHFPGPRRFTDSTLGEQLEVLKKRWGNPKRRT